MRVVSLALLLTGCALSHTLDGAGASGDGSVALDAGALDASASHDAGAGADAGSPVDAGPPVTCGPNVCRAGEICCVEECGVCAFPDECVDTGCT